MENPQVDEERAALSLSPPGPRPEKSDKPTAGGYCRICVVFVAFAIVFAVACDTSGMLTTYTLSCTTQCPSPNGTMCDDLMRAGGSGACLGACNPCLCHRDNDTTMEPAPAYQTCWVSQYVPQPAIKNCNVSISAFVAGAIVFFLAALYTYVEARAG